MNGPSSRDPPQRRPQKYLERETRPATFPVKLRIISCAREVAQGEPPKLIGATRQGIEIRGSEEHAPRGRIHSMARDREDPRAGRSAHLGGGSSGEAVAESETKRDSIPRRGGHTAPHHTTPHHPSPSWEGRRSGGSG